MSSKSTHFEVFLRKEKFGAWTMLGAHYNRAVAISEAKEILSQGGAVAVRVLKETFDEATGDFQSVRVFQEGDTADPPTKADAPLKVQLPCFKPEDLYSLHARRTIAQLLRQALSRWRITPTELLHHAGHINRLEQAGTELQHAVQKMAIKHAGATGQPVQQTVVKLNDLVDKAIGRVLRDSKANMFPNIRKIGFPELCASLAGGQNAIYVLNGAIALHIEGADSWRAKLALILELIESSPENGKMRDKVLTTIDSLIAEMLSGNAALGDLLGDQKDLGHALLMITDLFLGKIDLSDKSIANGVRTLSRLFSEGHLLESRIAIANRILKEISSARRLCPSSIDEEIKICRLLANRMVLGQGSLISADEILDAFTTRSKQFVMGDTVENFLEPCDTAFDRMDKLLDLEENIVGTANKRAVGKYFLGALISPRTEQYFLSADEPIFGRLAKLTNLQRRIRRSNFQENSQESMLEGIDRLAIEMEKRVEMFNSIRYRKISPAEKAFMLLRLLTSDVIPDGKLADTAREIVRQLVRDTSFKPSLKNLSLTGDDAARQKNSPQVFSTLLAQADVFPKAAEPQESADTA